MPKLIEPIDVLKEFVDDVEAVGVPEVISIWPDLLITYQRAKAVLRADELVVVEHHK